MHSEVRRRSHSGLLPTADMVMDPRGTQPRPPRKALLATALLATLLLAFLLISHTPSLSLWRHLPNITSLGSNRGPSKQETYGHSPNTFTLRPEDHVFRNATTVTHHWRITAGDRRPDGVLKRVYLVNGAFPGPTLELRQGDHLVVHVENALQNNEGISIHWHGLSMRGANAMDGAVGITQSPIEVGQTFTYDFTIDNQHGTFWWHAHDGVQRADGLYGGLAVHQPMPQDSVAILPAEHLLLVGDWYHRLALEALQFYMHPGAFGLETLPDSVLLNGAGAFKCSDAVPARPLNCKQIGMDIRPVLAMDPSERNMFRVVNVGSYAGFSIAVEGARLTALAVDGGHSIKGLPSQSVGFIYPGERVAILVEPDSDAESQRPYMNITLDETPFKYQNPALTISHKFPIVWNGELPAHYQVPSSANLDIQDVKSEEDQSGILPVKADHTIILYTLTQKLARLENEPHGFINHTTWSPQNPPLVEMDRSQWDKNQLVPQIESNSWVDLVVNNLDEDSHPFHLHGFDFWVLTKYSSTSNWGSYNPFEDSKPPGGEYDLTHAIKRDTFYIPRRGYAVLRFQANNPGLWMFHCHVLWHQASGMAMAFDVRA